MTTKGFDCLIIPGASTVNKGVVKANQFCGNALVTIGSAGFVAGKSICSKCNFWY
jgi:hypothetical protein